MKVATKVGAAVLALAALTGGAIELHAESPDTPERACSRLLVSDLHLPESVAVHGHTRETGRVFTVSGEAGVTRFSCTVRRADGRWVLVRLSSSS